MDNKRGISLVILIITIIVAIIIAGTVISTMTNEDIIGETKNVASSADKATIISAIKLETRKFRMEKELTGRYELTESEIRSIISDYGTISTVDGQEVLITEDNYQIPLSEIDSIFLNN